MTFPRERAAVAQATLEHEGQAIPVTASIGLSDLRPDDSREDLLKRADEALYRAKQLGRNRVEVDFAVRARRPRLEPPLAIKG